MLSIRIIVAFFIPAVAMRLHSTAQNLVPNPGFEEYYSCPFSFNNTYTNNKIAPGWISPSCGTPDLFNACGKDRGEANVYNWAGVSYPHTGSGYAGIYGWMQGGDYREYLQAALLEALEAGKKYSIEFYFKLSSYSMFSIDRIGAFVSDSAISYTNDKIIPAIPTLSVILDSAITPTTGQWEIARMEYMAKGGERYITIGNFYSWEQTNYFHLYVRSMVQRMLTHSAYFYIDDVSISEVPSTERDSLLVWPDGNQIKIEEHYTLRNIQFEFNKYELMPESFTELDRLAMILIEKPEWTIEVTGHTDDLGSELYNLELSKNRATSVGNYLELRGISKARITTQGFGESKPLIRGSDAANRVINRRVNVRFLSNSQ